MSIIFICIATLLILGIASALYVHLVNRNSYARHRSDKRRMWFEEPDQSSYFNCLINPPTDVEDPDLPPGSYVTYDGDQETLHEILEGK